MNEGGKDRLTQKGGGGGGSVESGDKGGVPWQERGAERW